MIDENTAKRVIAHEEEDRDQAAERGEYSLARYHDGRAMILQEILDGEYDPLPTRDP